MADLLHVDAIQHLEVVLLGLPTVQVINLLTSGWGQTKPVLMATSIQPHPQAYTSTPLASALTSVTMLGEYCKSLSIFNANIVYMQLGYRVKLKAKMEMEHRGI